jgi:hypothetical protein
MLPNELERRSSESFPDWQQRLRVVRQKKLYVLGELGIQKNKLRAEIVEIDKRIV